MGFTYSNRFLLRQAEEEFHAPIETADKNEEKRPTYTEKKLNGV